jgi:hypothetical protein
MHALGAPRWFIRTVTVASAVAFGFGVEKSPVFGWRLRSKIARRIWSFVDGRRHGP